MSLAAVHPSSSRSRPSTLTASGMSGMGSRSGHLKFRVKNPAESAKRIATFLRARYPRKTAEAVSADTGFAVKTVSAWLAGASCPGGWAYSVLGFVYGPQFLVATWPGTARWLDEAAINERAALLEANIEAQRRELERLR